MRQASEIAIAVLSVGALLACDEAAAPRKRPDAEVTRCVRPATMDAASGSCVALLGAPLAFAPTHDGFRLNAVVASGDEEDLRAAVRAKPDEPWSRAQRPEVRADDVAEFHFEGLSAATRYQYRLSDASGALVYAGEVMTQREPGADYSFVLITDTHIAPNSVSGPDASPRDFASTTLQEVAVDIAPSKPDFLIHLGDVLDFHLFGFNEPPPDASYTRLGYLNYRRLLGDVLGTTSHFVVIGNWDGECGDFTREEIERSRSQRLLYAPGPDPDTYPQGGGPHQDYYAFTWGDALFVVLNVMTYTTTPHRLTAGITGVADDWTLGEEQLAWLETTLERASSRWRFLLIHHAVGGAAGDTANAAYGRGGGQAAGVGEQAIVHQLMREHGVQIFFYGHDHVFTDLVVDGIHYTLPGSAGAPWKFDMTETGYSDYFTDSGHARVEVGPERVEVQFIAVGGELLESYTLE